MNDSQVEKLKNTAYACTFAFLAAYLYVNGHLLYAEMCVVGTVVAGIKSDCSS